MSTHSNIPTSWRRPGAAVRRGRRRGNQNRRHRGPFIEAFESRTLLAPGVLDPTFGVAGAVSSSLFGINDAAVQADGKVVVVGTKVGRNGVEDFAVARFNANGSLDGTFGSGGIAVTPIFLNGNLTPARQRRRRLARREDPGGRQRRLRVR